MTAGSLPHDPPALHLNRTTGIAPKTDNFLFTRVLVVLEDVMRFHEETSRRRVPAGQTHFPPSFKCLVCLHSLPLPSSPSIPPPSRSLRLSFIVLPALSPLCVLELAVGKKNPPLSCMPAGCDRVFMFFRHLREPPHLQPTIQGAGNRKCPENKTF